MQKNTVSGIMLTLLLFGSFALAFGVQSVKAEPKTWYVDDDGPADFSKIRDAIASPLVVDGDIVFVRSGTYHENHINVYKSLSLVGEDRETTIIDGDGYGPIVQISRIPPKPVNITGFTIQDGSHDWFYTMGSGVLLYSAQSCIISDLAVSDCRYGITSYQGRRNTITGNAISDTNQGIPLYYSRNEVVVGNEISNGVQAGSDPPYGIQVWASNNNKVAENIIEKISYVGISLDQGARNNIVSDNVISDIYGAEWPAGIRLWSPYNNTVTNNIVSNTYHGVSFIGPSISSNTVSYNTITNCSEIAVFFDGNVPAYYNKIIGNLITNSLNGIYFNYPYHNRVADNTLVNTTAYGIHFQMGGLNNTVIGNTIVNSENGIRLDYADQNVVTQNAVYDSTFAIFVGYESSDNIVALNRATNSAIGIFVVDQSHNNNISKNEVSKNYYGIALFSSNNNKIYHNNFIDNTQQVLLSDSFNTAWNNSYPSGGNYWSDYTDVDLFNGPDQDLFGMDGIWDHPYVIDSENQDGYPLVKPWPIIPVATDVDPDRLSLRSKGNWITVYMELPVGYDVNNIDVASIKLDDAFAVDFSAPIQVGDYDLDGIPDLMVKFTRAQLESYIYNVLGIKYGEVTLEITGQLTDGTPFEGSDTIWVNYAGDANNDGMINILDAATVSAHWYPGPPIGPLGYDANADLNNDGLVNILDSGIVSSNWGQRVP